MSYVVAALYHFFDFPHFREARMPLLEELRRREIKGTILVTPEGINGTIAGTREAIDSMLLHLKDHITGGEFEHKESLCDTQPFQRTKVRLKKETISIGEPTSIHKTGTYVNAAQWNALLDDPETVVIDSRNAYEVHLGTFDRAIDPHIDTFKELPAFVRENLDPAKHKKIATFCTGGIRCEKFTSWLLDQGFPEVYHLQGGILKYLEEMPQEHSKWHGDCYVFDERVAVNHTLAAAPSDQCPRCNHTLTTVDMQSPLYVKDERCPYC